MSTTRDQLQLALAQSLMKQGGPAGSPLAIFGNLARQAAGLQLQRRALDDIDARKQAAQTKALRLLTPGPSINAGILDEGFEPTEVVRQQNPSMANLISVATNENVGSAFQNLAAQMYANELTKDRTRQQQDFEFTKQQRQIDAQMDLTDLQVSSREEIARINADLRRDLADQKYSYVKMPSGVAIFKGGKQVGLSKGGTGVTTNAQIVLGQDLKNQGQNVADRNLQSEYVVKYNTNGSIKDIVLRDPDMKITSEGLVSSSAAVEQQADLSNFTPEAVGSYQVAPPATDASQKPQAPLDASSVQGIDRPLGRLGSFLSELTGNPSEGARVANLLEKTNATSVQIGASLPPSIARTKPGARLTDLVRNLELQKVPNLSTFTSDATFAEQVNAYMEKLNRVRTEVAAVARNSEIAGGTRQEFASYADALTDIMRDYQRILDGTKGNQTGAALEVGETINGVKRVR